LEKDIHVLSRGKDDEQVKPLSEKSKGGAEVRSRYTGKHMS
jgi:hypothetical protein